MAGTTNNNNRKGGSATSILSYFSKVDPKRPKSSGVIRSTFTSVNDTNNNIINAMTPLPSSTPFNPNLPPSSSATPASVSSEESASPRCEVTVESTMQQQQQQEIAHDTTCSTATPTNMKNNHNDTTPETPPTTHDLLNDDGVETPPSPDCEASLTPCTPPTPESEMMINNNNNRHNNSNNHHDRKRKRQRQQKATPSAAMDSIEETEEDTPQSLLDDDDDCANDEQLQRHEKTTTTATPSNSRCYTKSSSSSSVGTATSFRSSRKRRFNNKKRSLKSTQQQQQPPPQSTKKKKSNNHQQLFLDFGQSSFGKRSVCNICGMLRVHGVAEDDIQHAKVCKDYKEGVTCLGWKNERTLIHFNNDKTTPTRNDDRIIEVRDCDVVQHRRKVLEVKRIVDAELGFAISGRQGTTGSGLGDKDDDNVIEDPLNGLTSYLYISKKRVVGLLLVKRIQRAYQVVLPNSTDDTDDKKTASFSISRSLKSTRALLGIHQIWVHSSHRNKGIASKLVTAARDHLIFGMAIPLELVAFSSPTEEGLQFARSYVGVERPLVYDI